MENSKLKLGNFFDEKIIPYLDDKTITMVFGESGIGKSTLCYMYINSCLKTSKNKKVIYIDSENGFSTNRIKQINPNLDLKRVVILNVDSFEKQNKIIQRLEIEIKNSNQIGFIVIDSFTMLYRVKLGGVIEENQKFQKQLSNQILLLSKICKKYQIPILITNQTYKDFDTKEKKIVGGDLVSYFCKTIILLERDEERNKICKLIKHKFIKEREIKYEITNWGISKNTKRSFNFFNK